MPKWFNQFLVNSMPFIPRFLVGFVASRYVAGDTLADAAQCIRELNRNRFCATADVLGEHIHDLSETELPVRMYLDLIEKIAAEQLDCGISLKLSQLGLELDEAAAWRNFERILMRVREKDVFLRIDMEDSSLTDKTLEIFKRARSLYANIGIVLQACLFRSLDDLEYLLPLGVNVRICKGIYKEPAEIAHQSKAEINRNFMEMVSTCLNADGYAAIATHDLDLIHKCESFIRERRIPNKHFEFQALLGVPVQNTLKRLVQDGRKVRLYVPYGRDWYAYSLRRLRENPDIAGYVFRDLLKTRR